MRLIEKLGVVGGLVLGPAAALGAQLRHTRFLHPRGVVYRARVEPLMSEGSQALAQRLSGPALVRLSGAWWRRREWPDVLGLAIRFHEAQDLLLATIRQPITTLLAPTTTDQHDFLANDYYAVSPFEVDGFGRARFRAVPRRVKTDGADREEKLQAAVEAGQGIISLEVKLDRAYVPFASVVLEEKLELDQRALAFDPYRDGAGIRPVGFVHGLRRLTYPMARSPRHA